MDIQKEKNMHRAMVLRDELFDLANSFAGDETGSVAVQLHHACNTIARAAETLKPSIRKMNPPYVAENFKA